MNKPVGVEANHREHHFAPRSWDDIEIFGLLIISLNLSIASCPSLLPYGLALGRVFIDSRLLFRRYSLLREKQD